jgi:hypothetical protein
LVGVVVPTLVLAKRLVQPTPTPLELMQGASMSARVLSLACGEKPLPSSLPWRAVPVPRSTRFCAVAKALARPVCALADGPELTWVASVMNPERA